MLLVIQSVSVHFESLREAMRQVKLFKGIEVEIKSLEQEVNSWIEENQVNVVSIDGMMSPQAHSTAGQDRMSGSDVLVVVVYEK